MSSTELNPNILAATPFAVLLALIALAPLFFSNWWSRHYIKVTLALAVIPVIYYLVALNAGERVLHVTKDYVGFIALIGSLYVVSGGIHVRVKGEATPMRNVLFLMVGALCANLLGTTGASMLFIRPWIRMNKYRMTGFHIVFFIFIISNGGGCLTPIGDPPLFLGYLAGVPFSWTLLNCISPWAVGVTILLAMFYMLDLRNFKRASKKIRDLETREETWRFEGLSNMAFLAIIIGAVFIDTPPFAREALMALAAVGSYYTTKKNVHEANHFSFGPVKEVAILFVGIFATMMPALDWLAANAGVILGNSPSPSLFYWGSGALSSVLDNAPTYLSFLSATYGSKITHDDILQFQHLISNRGADLASLTGAHSQFIQNAFTYFLHSCGGVIPKGEITIQTIQMSFVLGNPDLKAYLIAISVGSVFFGANTYIGNGPNFMVKAVADHQKIHTPNFIAYIFKYTLPYMLPMLFVLWLLFFRK
jgi:Na+/H+ antiporter NhaD/arsenite permease-like protein